MGDVLAELEDFIEQTRASVHSLATVTEGALATTVSPRRADLIEIEPLVTMVLGEREEIVHGGGFVAAPHLLDDAPWWLEWFAWDAGGIQRLVSDTDPGGAHFFDYTFMPWYAGPREQTGSGGVVTGPYVDYLCTDDYTLTFTEGVWLIDGTFAGVAGVDVRILAVEQRFLSLMRASGRLLVLVNELGRVAVSTTSRVLSGDLVEDLDVPTLFAEGDQRLTRIAGSELGLLDLGPR